MKSIILFRFHGSLDVCRERLRIIKYFNPDTPVYGLFGGPRSQYNEAKKYTSKHLEDLRLVPVVDSLWKWLHPDLMTKHWFKSFGHKLDFDQMYDHEWDILFTDSMKSVFPQYKGRFIALSGLKKLDEVIDSWDWTSTEPSRSVLQEYFAYMKRKFGYRQTYTSQGPFPIFSRAFLEEFSACRHPPRTFDYVLSELTYPGFAEALNFEIHNSGLHDDWHPTRPFNPLFNCQPNSLVTPQQVLEVIKNPHGRRVFHPVKDKITLEQILSVQHQAAA